MFVAKFDKFVTMVLFLTNLILKRKTSLSKIWLAAHWDKKLTKYHIHQIDIVSGVHDIMCQEIILDLRLSGHLLVGIVKIFSRKTKYLLTECSEIFTRVADFRTNITDIYSKKVKAPVKKITLPEILENDLEFEKMDEDVIFLSNQSRIEEITLKETVSNAHLINDDEFGCFGEENIPINFDENIHLPLLDDDINAIMKENNLITNGAPPITDILKNIQGIKRRKRKLIIDEIKTLNREKFEKQLEDFSDIVVPLDLAPPSKRLMNLKEIGGAEKLLCQSGHKISSTTVQKLFKRNLKTHKTEEIIDESSCEEDTYISDRPEIERRSSCLEYTETNDLNGHSLAMGNSHPLITNEYNEQLNENVFRENFINSDSSSNGINPSYEQMDFADSYQQEKSMSGDTDEKLNCFLQDRIVKMLQILKVLFKEMDEIRFSFLVQTNRKMKVVKKFFSLLILKKYSIVELKQIKPFEEIFVTKGAQFMSACEEFLL
ncbi:double-strand-break repair protein rad21 homolog [Caerostris darwini]|uniref:Double-strand-break repair protein rad21 homolog n=1 Tax=Caerostris darwini TaxID=1538125 RepID=A0AAV4RTA4_9ARAC|nr:double-strand-break repair protein rad21 homolog [Caerostris darwini]